METLDDPIIVSDQRHQRCSFAIISQPHVDRRLDRPPEFLVVNDRTKAGDDASIDQALHPRPGGIGAQTDLLSKLAMTNPAIGLNLAEYFSVY